MPGHSRHFADISNNNAEFDAERYAAAGHLIVAVKASEGVTFTDPDHHTWTLHAHLHHLGVIHYHFARPDLNPDPAAEAEHFLRAVGGLAGGRDYLALDLERAVPAGFSHDPEWSCEFDRVIRADSRFRTVIYMSQSLFESAQGWWWHAPHHLWLAAWSGERNPRYQTARVIFRQYTDGVVGPEPHTFVGIGQCDGNYMDHDANVHMLHRRAGR